LEPYPSSICIKLLIEGGSIPLDAGLRIKGKYFGGHVNNPPEIPVLNVPEPVTEIPVAKTLSLCVPNMVIPN